MTPLVYVALGDSFTEGVGDDDPARPHGIRGWADRVAEVLADQPRGAAYANLAIRGRKLRAVLDEQVEPALALCPDLVTMYAGGNDILRPTVDVDDLVAEYAAAVARLRAAGAEVVLFTAFDVGRSPVLKLMRGRFAVYNELVREVADDLGCRLVDFWRLREFHDAASWSEDRIHLSPVGHARMAMHVLDVIGVDHGLTCPESGAVQPPRRDADLAWLRTHAAPWIHRRVTGRSSGDGLSPRFPAPVVGGPRSGTI